MASMSMVEFQEIIRRELNKLYALEDYLNEAGLARMKAFREVDNLLPFCDDLKELYGWDCFTEITLAEGQHCEYYKVMRMIVHKLDKEVKNIERSVCPKDV